MDEPDTRASLLAEEIADQPSAWRRAIEIGSAEPNPLGLPGRVAIVGCGSSWHAAKAIAALRERTGAGETDAFAASEAPLGRPYARIVAISRSGTTTEVRQALAAPAAAGVPLTAIVGDPDSPLAASADEVVDLSFADDRSVVQSRFVTTVVCLARTWLGEDTAPLPTAAAAALDTPLALDPAALDRAVFLATGPRVGLADAAALMLRETAQFWAESYPAMEYRHGPISVARPGSVVWSLGDVDGSVLEDAAGTGATVVTGELDAMAELVRIQRTAVALAEHRGMEPDHPRHLTRSVVLS